MDMCLRKLYIYQAILGSNCFRTTQILDLLMVFEKFCLLYGLKFNLYSVTSFVPDNLKKIILKAVYIILIMIITTYNKYIYEITEINTLEKLQKVLSSIRVPLQAKGKKEEN